jgi:hypothetical protein
MKQNKQAAPRLRFVREFTAQDALEAQDRGYLSHVLVELDGGNLYPVFFYDPTRLQQDLAEGIRSGRPFVADPGMIVVPEVTPDAMRDAVDRLVGEGFFDHLVPVHEADLGRGNPYCWPPTPAVLR